MPRAIITPSYRGEQRSARLDMHRVSTSSSHQNLDQIITPHPPPNMSGPPVPDQNPMPNLSAPVFNAKRLEAFSLGDFIELLEAAGMTPITPPTGMTPPGSFATLLEAAGPMAQVLAADAPATDRGCVDRLMESRFRFLVEHLRPDHPLTSFIGFLDSQLNGLAEAELLSFLRAARSLFVDVLGLKRREARRNRTNVPVAEAGQRLFTSFTMALPAAWSVDSNGRLARQKFPVPVERDLASRLAERLLKVLDGADPALFRRCAFSRCGRFFYARRVDQLCCSRKCNNGRLQREWYKAHGKSAVAMRDERREQMKLKGAKR